MLGKSPIPGVIPLPNGRTSWLVNRGDPIYLLSAVALQVMNHEEKVAIRCRGACCITKRSPTVTNLSERIMCKKWGSYNTHDASMMYGILTYMNGWFWWFRSICQTSWMFGDIYLEPQWPLLLQATPKNKAEIPIKAMFISVPGIIYTYLVGGFNPFEKH